MNYSGIYGSNFKEDELNFPIDCSGDDDDDFDDDDDDNNKFLNTFLHCAFCQKIKGCCLLLLYQENHHTYFASLKGASASGQIHTLSALRL